MNPICTDCVHFHVTWDKKAPRGCKAHGFKSDGHLAEIVYQTSGIPCQLFAEKWEKSSKPQQNSGRSQRGYRR